MKKFLFLVAVALLVTNFSFGQVFFSQYMEGGSNNKFIEIYNGTGVTLDLSGYVIKQANNGNGWGNISSGADSRYVLPLSGTVAVGDVYVVANASAIQGILDEADLTFAYNSTANGGDGDNVPSFNGDDALGLFLNNVLIDAIGDPSTDPGDYWEVAGTGKTKDFTLVRKATITEGNIDGMASLGTTAGDSEWTVLDKDDFTGIGSHTVSTAINDIDGLSTKIFTYGKLVSINTNMTNATVKIYDLTGKEVVKQTINKGVSKISTKVESGIYFVKVSNGKETATQKVFIK